MKRKESIVIDGLAQWRCCTCQEWKPSDAFYKDSRTPNGLKAQCKACHIRTSIDSRDPQNKRLLGREHMRRAVAENIQKFRDRWREAAKSRPANERTKAREILNRAVQSGKMTKPMACTVCGRVRKLTAHHPDYSKPLEVEWKCYECHANK